MINSSYVMWAAAASGFTWAFLVTRSPANILGAYLLLVFFVAALALRVWPASPSLLLALAVGAFGMVLSTFELLTFVRFSFDAWARLFALTIQAALVLTAPLALLGFFRRREPTSESNESGLPAEGVFPRVRQAQVALAFTPLWCFLVFAYAAPRPVFCGPHTRFLMLLVATPAWLYPYARGLWVARPRSGVPPNTVAVAMAAAVQWSVLFLGVVVLTFRVIRDGLVGDLVLLSTAGLSLVLVITTCQRAYRSLSSSARGWKNQGAGLVRTAMVALGFLSLAVLPPSGIGSQTAASEFEAVANLRTISTAQYTYLQTNEVFAATLAELAAAGFLDERWSGEPDISDYRYDMALVPADSFVATARPIRLKNPGCRSFVTDGSGVVRGTEEDRSATIEDPPVQ